MASAGTYFSAVKDFIELALLRGKDELIMRYALRNRFWYLLKKIIKIPKL